MVLVKGRMLFLVSRGGCYFWCQGEDAISGVGGVLFFGTIIIFSSVHVQVQVVDQITKQSSLRFDPSLG